MTDEASILLVKIENGGVDRECWACLDESECQRVGVTDQVCDNFTGVFWDGVTGLEDDCPVAKEVLVKGEESQLGLRGVVKNCCFQRLKDVLIEFWRVLVKYGGVVVDGN